MSKLHRLLRSSSSSEIDLSCDHRVSSDCITIVYQNTLTKWKSVPQSMKDFNENFLTNMGTKIIRVMWFLFGAICWTLWLNRNDYIFNNKLISSPRAIIFRLMSFCSIEWL
jgi:hypothetical protein